MQHTRPDIVTYDFKVAPTIVYDKQTLTVITEKGASDLSDNQPSSAKQTDESQPLTYSSIYKKLQAKGNISLLGPLERFKELGKIGEGSTANVVACLDTNTNREVAVKILKSSDEEIELLSFIKEAHTASSLEHPNIVPLYDLDIDENGNVCMILKKVTGHSLKKYINTKKAGKEDPYICNIADIVNLFLKICDALAYAHNQGYIHQDIKPENIMIGRFGQAFLIDWGASSFSEEYLTVSPPYMSPQQANGCDPEKTDDIYCLGATLYHVLTLQFPTVASTIDDLWEKKRQGLIEPPTEYEKTSLPPPLMAIVRKALDANVKKRYQSIEAFEQDLKNYQAGLSISAYRYTLRQFLTYFYKQHKHGLMTSLLVLVLLAAFSLFYYNLKLKEIAYWGKPIFSETFSNDKWRESWQPLKGDWRREEGRMISDKGNFFFLFYRKRLEGPVAIEFDAEILPGASPCDLSVAWCPTRVISEDIDDYYFLQAGANENTHSRIFHKNVILAYHDFVLTPGQKYHIRADVDDNHMTLFVDGRQLCRYRSPFPFTGGGYIGLYGYSPGKAFDNVKVYNKGVAQKIPATAIGDEYFKRKQYSTAADEYEKVRLSQADTELAAEAAYKQGLCLYKLQEGKTGPSGLKQRSKALSLWHSIQTGYFGMLAKIEIIRDNFEHGKHLVVLQELEQLGHDKNYETQQEAARLWNQIIVTLCKRCSSRTLFNSYLSLRDRVFNTSEITHYNAANALRILGRYDEIYSKFPKQEHFITWSLSNQGKFNELLKTYPHSEATCLYALYQQKRFQDMLETYPEQRTNYSEPRIMHARGQFEDVLKRYPKNRFACGWALLYLGRYEELQKDYPDQHMLNQQADLLQNNYESVIARSNISSSMFHQAKYLKGINLFINGKPQEALAYIRRLDKEHHERPLPSSWFDCFLEPFLQFLHTRNKANFHKQLTQIVDTKRFYYRQTPWFFASYLLGKMDQAAFRKIPSKLHLESQELVCEAMQAEVNNKPALALAKYKQFLALPVYKRELNPVIEKLAGWREQVLSQTR